MNSSLTSNNKGMAFVDENSLNTQLQSYVQVRELHKYTEQQLTKSANDFDEKLSHYVKNEDLNAKMVDLLKEKRDSFRFWFPIVLSAIISLIVTYLTSHN